MTRLCLALDVPRLKDAESLVAQTCGVFDTYKIGLELFTSCGWSSVERIRDAGAASIFLDLKLHDIPRTVHRSILTMEGRGVDFLTIHLGGGRKMLEESRLAADRIGLHLLGVSVLTSLDGDDLVEIGLKSDVRENIRQRCRLAVDAGIFGVVSSPLEARMIKSEVSDELYCVTPGIRFMDDAAGDQKRVMTPTRAVQQGADMLVIGRSITQANDLEAALDRLKGLGKSHA